MGSRIAVSYQFDSIKACKEILNTMAKCASYNEQQKVIISSTFMSNLILSTTTIIGTQIAFGKHFTQRNFLILMISSHLVMPVNVIPQ